MYIDDSQDLFKALFHTIKDPILIYPLSEEGFTPFVLVNKAATEVYGYSEEELYKLTIQDITNTTFDKKFNIYESRKKLKKEKKNQFDVVHVTKSGKSIVVDINAIVINHQNQDLIVTIVSNTKQKPRDEKLIEIAEEANETSNVLETVINTIPVRLFWKDSSSTFLGCNDLFASDAGKVSPQELIGKNDYEMPWFEQADLYRSDDKQVMETRQSKINYEEPQTNSEGKTSWLRTSKIPLIDHNNVVTGILGTYEDITLRKEQELALENTQKELLFAQKIAKLGNWIYDIETRTFKFSEELCRTLGYLKKQMTISYEDWERVTHEDDREKVVQVIKNAIATKKFFTINHRIVRLDDKAIKWLQVRGEYHELDNGIGCVKGTAQDFTKLKTIQLELESHKDNLELLVKEKTKELEFSNKELTAINEEVMHKNQMINDKNVALQNTLDILKETQVKLIQADKMASLGILTAGISHELNNPLNFIHGGLLGLKSILSPDAKTSEVNELFDAIETGVSRATDIIAGLNQFNRTNENYDETCDIHSILDNSLMMLHNKTKYRVQIEKKYCEKIIKINGNVGKLHQVFVNLISNANQAIEDKGTIAITTECKKDKVIISIKDTGCGMDKESLQRIFDPFYTTKEPGKGLGLGLSITYNIIEEHGGTIKYQSEKGIGTTAIITFPN